MHKPSLDQVDFGINLQELPARWGRSRHLRTLENCADRAVEQIILLHMLQTAPSVELGIPADALEPSQIPQTDAERRMLKSARFALLYGGHSKMISVATGRTVTERANVTAVRR